MKILFVVAAAVLALGLLVNLVMTRTAWAPIRPLRLLGAALICIAVSASLASIAVETFVQVRCDPAKACDYASPLEGGLLLTALWLAVYAGAYLVTAQLVARLQRGRGRA